MKFGFSQDDEYEPESTPSHVGEIGQLTTESDEDSGGDAGWTFTHHIYFAVHIGPFMFVIGRPE